MITDACRAEILGNTAVAALVGTRMYPHVAPQGVSQPFLTYSVAQDDATQLVDGNPSALRMLYLDVDCYSLSQRAAHQLALAVETAICSATDTLGTDSPPQQIDVVRLERKFDLFEGDTKLYRVSLQFVVGYYPT